MMTATTTERAAGGLESDASGSEEARPGLRRRLLGDVRTRIIASYVVLLFISALATVLIVRQVLVVRLDDRVDRELAQEVGEFRALAGGVDPATGEPFGPRVGPLFDLFFERNIPGEGEQLITIPEEGGAEYRGARDAQLRLPSLVAEASALDAPGSGEIETEAGPVRYVTIPVEVGGEKVGTFAVANFLAGEREEVDEAVTTVAIVAAIILLGGTVAAFLVVGRVVAPLREFRDAARSVTGADMTQRINVRGDDELAELGRTFNLMLDRLELAFGSQREFIRDAGHELRTPIAIVRGHLELLAEEDDADTQRGETYEMLGGELDRMTRFVNDMLLLAKAERPDFLQLETVSLADFCDEVLLKASALGDREWRVDSRNDATIVADRQRLTQAVVNLVSNSVANSLPGDAITIGSRVVGSSALISVEDEGRGIDPAEQAIVLEPFRRGRGARYEGSGLGLPIVVAIATAHGGTVEITGELGRGTNVTLRLPIEGPGAEMEGENA